MSCALCRRCIASYWQLLTQPHWDSERLCVVRSSLSETLWSERSLCCELWSWILESMTKSLSSASLWHHIENRWRFHDSLMIDAYDSSIEQLLGSGLNIYLDESLNFWTLNRDLHTMDVTTIEWFTHHTMIHRATTLSDIVVCNFACDALWWHRGLVGHWWQSSLNPWFLDCAIRRYQSLEIETSLKVLWSFLL